MAPRRGGGGGGGGGGIKGCSEYAFQDTPTITYMVYYVLFTVAVIGIFIAASSIKKKHGHAKQLLGGTYFTALFFTLLGHLLYWIFLTVNQCRDDISLDAYAGISITSNIFWWIGDILLLTVFLWGLVTALQQRLGGLQRNLFQTISWVALGIVAVLGATLVSIDSYNVWSVFNGDIFDEEAYDLQKTATRLGIAYGVLYMIAALIGGTLALLSLFRLRPQAPVTGPIVWAIVLTLCLVIRRLISISLLAVSLDGGLYPTQTTALALLFIQLFFAHLAFVVLIIIAKAGVFSQQAGVYPPASYEQPAYNGPQYAAVPQQGPPQYHPHPEQPAQLPNNTPAYYGQPQLDGSQRYEVKG